MDIESLTIGDARTIAGIFAREPSAAPCPFPVGTAWLIRTVTHAWTGRVRAVVGQFLVLDGAAWIADLGRYAQATTADALAEVEPAGDGVVVGLGAIVDARPWAGELPRVQK